jgi:CubicO group peptidase (beta-lactamase class C family)
MNNLKNKLKMGILTALILLINSRIAFNQLTFTKQTGNELDKLLSEQFKKGEPGCAAIVGQKGKIVYKKALGMANLELNVPMNPDMVFRIGSMTKQFTAIAILQLMEQGKLDLQDNITKFIPDYPTGGQRITIENLLTHTSGIKSYTSDPEFTSYMRNDKKPAEVINLFKDKPLEFVPGTQWSYSNSGYFLLGYIIEKVSGRTYAQYLDDNFFKPLGMTSSFFGSDSRIIMNRASGYQKGDNGILNASIISMTIPYSAGSILSTVEDLYKWNQALHSYRLVKKETLSNAFTEYHLADGKGTGYGYGWFLRKLQGSPTIEHGGGINGFLTSGVYLPDEDVFVAVLSNSTSNQPELVTLKMAALLIGKPYKFIEIPYDNFTPGEYKGIYGNDEKNTRSITVENNKLYSQSKGGFMTLIIPYQKDKFVIENSFTTIEFKRDPDSKVSSMVVDDRGNIQTLNIADTLVPVRKEVKVSEAVMDRYTGGYQIAAGFTVLITREGDKMFAQGTGQNKVSIFAETDTRFFIKAIDAQIEFIQDDKGNVSKLILYQGGRRMEGPRINE